MVEPVPFHLHTLKVNLHGRESLEERVFAFLTSSSTTSLVSADLPGFPHSPAGDATVYDLSPFLSLTSLHLFLPVVKYSVLPADESLLAAFFNQLDTLPSSVRRLALYSASTLAEADILSHIPASVHTVDVGGVYLGAAYVAEFFNGRRRWSGRSLSGDRRSQRGKWWRQW